MYKFTKQNYIEVETGIEDVNYQSEVAILTAFFKKRSLKDPKMKKWKKAKN